MTHTSLSVTIGRMLLGLYFLVPGIMKFTAFDLHLGMMAHHGVPLAMPGLIFAGASAIIGALLLFANRYVRLVSFGFVLYILIVNVTLHGFWKFEGVEARHEMQNFIKNLGIMAGLLVLAGVSARRPLSLSGLAMSDRVWSGRRGVK